jgi:hypothetical protein
MSHTSHSSNTKAILTLLAICGVAAVCMAAGATAVISWIVQQIQP